MWVGALRRGVATNQKQVVQEAQVFGTVSAAVASLPGPPGSSRFHESN